MTQTADASGIYRPTASAPGSTGVTNSLEYKGRLASADASFRGIVSGGNKSDATHSIANLQTA